MRTIQKYFLLLLLYKQLLAFVGKLLDKMRSSMDYFFQLGPMR